MVPQADKFFWGTSYSNGVRLATLFFLCNSCRIKLNISVDSLWFCTDHDDMHQDDDENKNKNKNS